MLIVLGTDKSINRGSKETIGKEMVDFLEGGEKVEFGKVFVLVNRENKRTTS